ALLKNLLHKSPPPSSIDIENRPTALTTAASRGYTRIVQLLLAGGADPNAKGSFGFPPLTAAAMNGHADIVNLLLDKGADSNLGENHSQTTASMYMAAGG